MTSIYFFAEVVFQMKKFSPHAFHINFFFQKKNYVGTNVFCQNHKSNKNYCSIVEFSFEKFNPDNCCHLCFQKTRIMQNVTYYKLLQKKIDENYANYLRDWNALTTKITKIYKNG